jgi:hypothetical protein
MATSSKATCRGPMIHIRLDGETHRQLRILVAEKDSTIQQLVNDLIRREIDRTLKQKLSLRG